MHRHRLLGVALPMALALVFGGLVPRGVMAQPVPATFGTTSEVAHVVGAWDFETLSGTPSPGSSFGERRCASVGCDFFASLRLPSGALVSRIALDGCDADGSAAVSFQMVRMPSPATVGSVTLVADGFTGTPASPGCAIFNQPLDTPLTIDNEHFNYQLYIFVSTSNPDVSFTAVRVYYTLQVSPAPATATFADVPASHPFFRFIEALVASGVTAGCGGGNYCPDAPLTRGQMAVFLGKALGLHFAP